MKFQVIVPPFDEDGFQVTLKIEAKNWMGALRSALTKIGEGAERIRDIQCDVQDDGTFKITDNEFGRVFLVSPVVEGATPAVSVPTTVKREVSAPAPVAAAPIPEQTFQENVSAKEALSQAAKEEEARRAEAKRAEEERKAAEAKRLEADRKAAEARRAEDERKAAELRKKQEEAKRAEEELRNAEKQRLRAVTMPAVQPQPQPQQQTVSVSQTLETRLDGASSAPRAGDTIEFLADAFDATFELFEQTDTQSAVEFILGQALKKVPSQAGAVFYLDLGNRDLYFGAVEGASSKELEQQRIPVGRGILGTCIARTIALAMPEVTQDPRYDKRFEPRYGFDTVSTLCMPIYIDGRSYGILQLVNRKESGSYTRREVSVITYLAEQLARWLNRYSEL